jgi:hypothetical protein
VETVTLGGGGAVGGGAVGGGVGGGGGVRCGGVKRGGGKVAWVRGGGGRGVGTRGGGAGGRGTRSTSGGAARCTRAVCGTGGGDVLDVVADVTSCGCSVRAESVIWLKGWCRRCGLPLWPVHDWQAKVFWARFVHTVMWGMFSLDR